MSNRELSYSHSLWCPYSTSFLLQEVIHYICLSPKFPCYQHVHFADIFFNTLRLSLHIILISGMLNIRNRIENNYFLVIFKAEDFKLCSLEPKVFFFGVRIHQIHTKTKEHQNGKERSLLKFCCKGLRQWRIHNTNITLDITICSGYI
jgi:hypothetical protein